MAGSEVHRNQCFCHLPSFDTSLLGNGSDCWMAHILYCKIWFAHFENNLQGKKTFWTYLLLILKSVGFGDLKKSFRFLPIIFEVCTAITAEYTNIFYYFLSLRLLCRYKVLLGNLGEFCGGESPLLASLANDNKHHMVRWTRKLNDSFKIWL